MKKVRRSSLWNVAFVAVIVLACVYIYSNHHKIAGQQKNLYAQYQRQANQIYQKMTEDERIGQLLSPSYSLLLGSNGAQCAADIETDPRMASELTLRECGLDQIAQYHIGTVLMGGGPYVNAPTLGNWVVLNAAAVKEHQIGSPLDPLLLTGNDLVHGNQHIEGGVIFPHNIGLGVTHDPQLVQEISRLAGEDSLASGFNWAYMPTVAVAQDYRWGRSYESFGADPQLVKLMAYSAIVGVQNIQNGKITGALGTVKHFMGDGATQYGLDEGDDQYKGSEQDFLNKNFPGYEGAVNADVGSLMVSYSAIDGDKTRMHFGGKWDLLNRFKTSGLFGSDHKKYQFSGFVVTDWNGPTRAAYFYGQAVGKPLSLSQAIAQSVNAGVDVVMLGPGDVAIPYKPENDHSNPYNFTTLGQVFAATREAVDQGLISQQRLQDAVTRILAVKLAMAPQVPVDYAALQAKERELALKAAEESLVLLKNQNNTLPLQKSQIKNVIFIGDVNDVGIQNGGWTITWQGQKGNQYFEGANAISSGAVTLAQGVQDELGTGVRYYENPAQMPKGVNGKNTVVIALLAEPPYAEYMGDIANTQDPSAPGYDHWYNDSYSNTNMPKVQSQYLGLGFTAKEAKLIQHLHRQHIKVVTVVYSGRPLVLSDPLKRSDALIAAFLPGTRGGEALANAIFGQYRFGQNGYSNVLTFPWPANMEQVKNHFQNGRALYPIGYGLKD